MTSSEYREVSERKRYRIPLFFLRVTRSTFLEPLAEPQGKRNPAEGGPENIRSNGKPTVRSMARKQAKRKPNAPFQKAEWWILFASTKKSVPLCGHSALA